MNEDNGVALSGRAGRPTAQAPAGLGDTATIPNAIKVCKDCRHYSAGSWYSACRRLGFKIDVVHGWKDWNERGCGDERKPIKPRWFGAPEDRCGAEGKYWSPQNAT